MLAIGIDLGTTYSCMSVWRDDQCEIIPCDGHRTIPSCIAWLKNHYICGQAAMNHRLIQGSHTINNVKRIIGRSWSDEITQYEIQHSICSIIERDNECRYVIDEHEWSSEEVSAMILKYMVEQASKYLAQHIMQVVITVPAYFNDSQRQATRRAGELAGLNVLRIINEPSAAALTYGLHTQEAKKVIVFDCGGGTHDVTLLSFNQGVFIVMATDGHAHLGGEDFDQRIIQYAQTFLTSNLNVNERIALKNACTLAKHTMSDIVLSDQIIPFSEDIFQSLCHDLLDQTLVPLQNVLQACQLNPSDIDDVVLVGGSTRIVVLQTMLNDIFGASKIKKDLNPDEAVAMGAAIQAAIITQSLNTQNMVYIDVTPLSLGVEISQGMMSVIVEKNSALPLSASRLFTTHYDQQTEIILQVYEGERKFTKNNHLLETFHLQGIAPRPKGEPQIQVTFNVNVNGILNIVVQDLSTNYQQHLTIRRQGKYQPQQAVHDMLQQTIQYASIDEAAYDVLQLKYELECTMKRCEQHMIDAHFDAKDVQIINTLCQKFETLQTKSDYELALDQLQMTWAPLFLKYQNK